MIDETIGDENPPNFTRIDRSQRNQIAYINHGSSSTKHFLSYRVYIERLECLWNESTVSRLGDDRSYSTPDKFPSSPAANVHMKKFHFDSHDNCIVESDVIKPGKRSESSIKDIAYDETLGEIPSRPSPSTPLRLSILGDMRPDITVVDSQGELLSFKLRRLLHPILAALYVRSNESNVEASMIAIRGLIQLLTETDFFDGDFLPSQNISPLNITSLDLTIDAVCDHFESVCLISHREAVLAFLRHVVQLTRGTLSDQSRHRMFKALSFICSFHFSSPEWEEQDFDPPLIGASLMDPAFGVIKFLVTSTIEECEVDPTAHSLPFTRPESIRYENGESAAYVLINELVLNFVDDVVDSFLTSRLCENACLLISKQSSSVYSKDFLNQVSSLGRFILFEFPLPEYCVF